MLSVSPRSTLVSTCCFSPYTAPGELQDMPPPSTADSLTPSGESPLDDPRDLHNVDFAAPGPAPHPLIAGGIRNVNHAVMRAFLSVANVVLWGGLRMSGYHRTSVETRMGRLNAFWAEGKGSLPPVTVVLGIAGACTDYLMLLRKLVRDHRSVLAVDLPGHGYSEGWNGPADAEWVCGAVEDAFEQLITEPTVLLGHSMGGLLAARYALAHPEKVQGLILAEPTGAPFTPTEYANFRSLYTMETREHARVVVHNAFYGEQHMLGLLTHASWHRLNTPVAQRMIESDLFSGSLTPQELSGLRMPTLLLWGAQDHLLPRWHLDYFRDNLPLGSKIEVAQGLNHNNTAKGPPAVLEPLQRFSQALVTGQALVPLATKPMDMLMARPWRSPLLRGPAPLVPSLGVLEAPAGLPGRRSSLRGPAPSMSGAGLLGAPAGLLERRSLTARV